MNKECWELFSIPKIIDTGYVEKNEEIIPKILVSTSIISKKII